VAGGSLRARDEALAPAVVQGSKEVLQGESQQFSPEGRCRRLQPVFPFAELVKKLLRFTGENRAGWESDVEGDSWDLLFQLHHAAMKASAN